MVHVCECESMQTRLLVFHDGHLVGLACGLHPSWGIHVTKILLSFMHLSDFQYNPAQASVVEADEGESSAEGFIEQRGRV